MAISPAVSSAMHGAVVPIASATVTGSSTNQYTFTNIPQGYQDLYAVAFTRSDYAGVRDQLLGRINGNSGSIYSTTHLYGDGASAASGRDTSNTWIRYQFASAAANVTSGIFGSNISHILNYANSTTYKTILQRSAVDENGQGLLVLDVTTAQTTSSITSFQFFCGNGNFVAGSTFALYGIRTVGQ
jgi:hypothetical protein